MFEVNAELIRAMMMKRKRTLTDLSHETRLNPKTCAKLVNGDRVNLKVIAAAAQAFGIKGEDLILKEELA